MTTSTTIKPHTLFESMLYHLLPGVLIGLVYYLLAPVVRSWGYPTVMALNLTSIIILAPVELGILFWQAKKHTGHFRPAELIPYWEKLPWWQYLIWIPIIFVVSGLIMTLFNPINTWLAGWFSWIPESLHVGMGLSADFTRTKLVQTYLLFFALVVIAAPTIEELYFRGFLLPRMPEKLGWARPIVHSLLFALYHVWSPWMFLARTAAVLPLIFGLRWKKNLTLAIVVHWLMNSIDFIMGVVFILGMGGG